LSNRKEGRKWREHKPEGTQGFPRLEVFEKNAMKKDDHNHPNSLQRGNYEIEFSENFKSILSTQLRKKVHSHRCGQV